MTLPVAILAGGLATRLRPLTLNTPKSLVPINGVPFIEWQLRYLAKAGIESVVLCLGHKALEIKNFVGDGHKFGLKIDYSIEKTPLGTGGAVKNAKHLLGDVFGLLYGDSYLPIDYLSVFDRSLNSEKSVLMTIYKNRNDLDVSNVILRPNGDVHYSKNHPTDQMSYIDYGFSVLKKEALTTIPIGIASDLSDSLEILSKNGKVEGFEVRERFYEVGSFSGIVDLEKYLRSHRE
jgi:NDP-sugar pyrophosphorylase family protein